MALRALRLRLRLRRTLTALPSISRSLSSPNPISVPSCSLLPGGDSLSSSSPEFFHCRSFRSSAALLSSDRRYKLYKEGDEIDENTILFEGCDYNHWLIVVDFPRDKPKPPAGEMIQTYERICAQGLGVSIEEAKKRIYACSTTVYEGFQVEMTEEASKKFEDLPGVVFVLPDSYINPVNKQYGGDKYENGVITPRPLPPQYNNYNRRRPRDRDDRGRYDQQGRQTQSWQQNPPYSHQGQPQGDGRNLGPQQGYPAQSYGSGPSVNNESYTPQPAMNNQSYGPPPQQSMSSQSYTQPPPMNNQNSGPQSPMNSQNYGIPPSTNNQNYGPGRRDPYQGDGSGTSPPVYRGNFSQDGQINYHPQEQMGQGNVAPSGPVASPRFGQGTNTSYSQGNWQGTNPASGQGTTPGYIRQVPAQGSNPGSGHGLGPSYGQNYSQGENPGYGHGINTGSGQGPSPGYNSQVPGQGVNPGSGQGGDPSYGQPYGQGVNPGYAHGDGQRLPHTEESSPIGPAGTVQGRF